MLLASACLLALGQVSPIEVTILDPHRRLAWTPAGKPLDYEATRPKSSYLGGDVFEMMGVKEQDRIALLRIPWTRTALPSVVIQFPSGGRLAAPFVTLTENPKKSWISAIKIPRSASEHAEGMFEFGVANGPWRTTGTQWPAKKRVKGEAFNVRLARSGKTLSGEKRGGKHWSLTSTLSRVPRHLAWRLLPYGNQERPMGPAGSVRIAHQNAWTYYFVAKDAKSEVTRIDLQRRPFEWTKIKNLALDPVTKHLRRERALLARTR